MQRDPYLNEHLLFSRDEYVAAHSLIMSREKAERFVDETFSEAPPEAEGLPSHLGEDTLDLLSLVSDACAERVRQINGDSDEAARFRREAFRNRLGI